MMNSEDPTTPGGVVLTVIALFLSLLKLICWGRRWRGGDTLVWGTEEGTARREGLSPPRAEPQEFSPPPLKCFLPGEGTWRGKGHMSHFQALYRLA